MLLDGTILLNLVGNSTQHPLDCPPSSNAIEWTGLTLLLIIIDAILKEELIMLSNWLKTGGRRQAPPAATSQRLMTAGREQCPYCDALFSPQGLPGHIKFKHADQRAPKKARTGGGRVKLRTQNKDGTFTTLTAEESELLLLREQGLAATIEPPKKTVIEEVPEKEVVDLVSDEQMEDAPQQQQEEMEAEAGGEMEVEEEEADLRIRGQNWSVSQKAEILQLWDDNEKSKPPEFVTKLGKKAFCRRMELKYKRKLQANKLRDWIESRDIIGIKNAPPTCVSNAAKSTELLPVLRTKRSRIHTVINR